MDNTDPQTSAVIPGTEGLSGAQDSSAPAGVQTTSPVIQPAPSPAAPAARAPQSVQPVQPGTPHAGLRNIIQSLADGMDAFATSAATGGQQGGVEEIQQLNAQRQKMQLDKQAGAREQQQSDAIIQHMQALTNATIAQTEINKINAPLEHQKLVIGNQDALYDLYVNKLHINPLFAVPIVQGQTTDAHMAAINGKANGDLVNHTVIPVHDDTVGGPGNSYGFSFDQLRKVNVPIDQAAPVLANLQNQINFAKGVLPNGEKDPAIQAAQGKLDVLKKGATINGYDFFNFDTQVQAQILSRVNNQQAISDFQQKQAAAVKAKNEADPLFKMENEPGEMSGEKSAAAIPLLQSKLTDPATAPADKVRASRLLAVAQSAHNAYINDLAVKAKVEQAAKQGDYKAAGQMLADGLETQAGLKMRGTTTDFILKAVQYARTINPKYNPADEVIAEQQAKSETNVQFFGSANSLIQKGGTLDQLVAAGKNLPNAHLPIYNKVADFLSASNGRFNLPAYHATALGVADDYAKVMGGGQGSDSSRMQAYNLIAASLNQGQREAAAEAIRKGVGSQVESRIGTNQFMMRRFGYALPQNQPAAATFDPKTDFKPITPQATQ